ncbi:MAG: M12 family metallo-peptidase [Pseudomonadota bacterium]
MGKPTGKYRFRRERGGFAGFALLLSLSSLPAFGQDQAFGHQPKFLEALQAPESPTISQTVSLSRADVAKLTSAVIGDPVSVAALSLGLAKGAAMEFKRIAIRAPGARVVVDDGVSARELPPTRRRFFLAHSATGGASFSLDPESGRVHGLLVDGGHSYQIDGGADGSGGLTMNLKSLREGRSRAGFSCGQNHTHKAEYRAPAIGRALAAGRTPGVRPMAPSMRLGLKGSGQVLYQAVIAVDTDNEFLFDKFANNTGNAQDWVEDVFVAMNAFYEPDLGLRLLLGDLILRIDNTPANDPDYNADPEDFNTGLSQFRSYFQNNENGRARSFTALFSGRDISSRSFSGVAYVGAYCNSFSYSLNRIGSRSSPAFIAGGVGHEIGHNLGSSHTHCEALRPNGGFVDQCYSRQRNGCYEGPTSCPSGVDGSLMSYCHAGASGFDGSGPAEGTSERCSVSDYFHPLIIGKLDSRIASNNPSCIADFDDLDLLLRDGFE